MITNIKDEYLFSRDIFEWDLYLIIHHLAEKIKLTLLSICLTICLCSMSRTLYHNNDSIMRIICSNQQNNKDQ